MKRICVLCVWVQWRIKINEKKKKINFRICFKCFSFSLIFITICENTYSKSDRNSDLNAHLPRYSLLILCFEDLSRFLTCSVIDQNNSTDSINIQCENVLWVFFSGSHICSSFRFLQYYLVHIFNLYKMI